MADRSKFKRSRSGQPVLAEGPAAASTDRHPRRHGEVVADGPEEPHSRCRQRRARLLQPDQKRPPAVRPAPRAQPVMRLRSGRVSRRKMSCAGWRDSGGEGGRPSASNGIGRRAWLQPRGRPIEQEVPTVVHGMRCPARLVAARRVDDVWAVEGVVIA